MLQIPQERPEPVLRALVALEGNDDWSALRAWLEDEASRLQRLVNHEREAAALHQGQGALQVLQSLFDFADQADEQYNRWRQRIQSQKTRVA